MLDGYSDWLAAYLARHEAEEALKRERAMSIPVQSPEAVAHPRIIPKAEICDVLWEQFEAVLASEGTDSRYLAIRAILLEPFSERSEKAQVAGV